MKASDAASAAVGRRDGTRSVSFAKNSRASALHLFFTEHAAMLICRFVSSRFLLLSSARARRRRLRVRWWDIIR